MDFARDMPRNITRLILIVTALSLSGCKRHEPTEKEVSNFWKRHTIDNSSLGADGVRTQDVNRDGLPDLVTGWEQGGVSRIYLMQHKSERKPTWDKVDAGPAPSVEDALLVDVDQDGAFDVISSTEGRNRKVLIHWAPTNWVNYTDSTQW